MFTGYFLGRYIPGIDAHIEKLIIAVIILSLMPALVHWIQAKRRQRAASSETLTD